MQTEQPLHTVQHFSSPGHSRSQRHLLTHFRSGHSGGGGQGNRGHIPASVPDKNTQSFPEPRGVDEGSAASRYDAGVSRVFVCHSAAITRL